MRHKKIHVLGVCHLRDISKVATPLLQIRVFFEVPPDSKLYVSHPFEGYKVEEIF